jgi:4-hydroxy-tetrahydrodipicolinate reductase
LNSSEFELTGAIARQSAGRDIGNVLGISPTGIRVSSGLDDALQRPADVLIDYTEPSTVKARTLKALERGVRVVIGTSGLTAEDFTEIERRANDKELGVIAAGNFSITAALAKHFALYAAKHLPSWEILDYAHADKPDSPSGTTQELAEEMAAIARNRLGMPIEKTHGSKHARGAMVAGTPIHSIRLPSYMIAFETIFGLPDERLTIRHDAGSGSGPYVAGTLLAAKEVMLTRGLVRGLDRLLFRDGA